MPKKNQINDSSFNDLVDRALEPSDLQHRLLIARMLGHDKDYLNEIINKYYDTERAENEVRKTEDKNIGGR
jgi:hypothetical protein|tara:strand:- start:2613 stop:2825 length:213 start_codon:yes stop_codon:yes gene_type:complete